MGTWIDISQRLDDNVAVWPGDTPFSYKVNWSKEQSGSVICRSNQNEYPYRYPY